MRQDFRKALEEFLTSFEEGIGISWDEAIEVFEWKIAEMRRTMARNT